MTRRLKRMDMSNNYMQQFMNQIPDLIATYIKANIDSKNRAKDIIRDDRIRKENKEHQIYMANQNFYNELYKGMHNDLQTQLDTKYEELNTAITELETAHMSVKGLDKVNRTQSYAELLSNAMSEDAEGNSTYSPLKFLKEDIEIIEGLLLENQKQINKANARADFMISLNQEIALVQDNFISSDPNDVIEARTQVPTWSGVEYEGMVQHIMADPEFMKKNVVHITNGEWNDYATDYTDRVSKPGDLALHEITKQYLERDVAIKDQELKNLTHKVQMGIATGEATDSAMLSRQIAAELTKIENNSKALMGIPSFRNIHSKVLNAYNEYKLVTDNIDSQIRSQEDADFLLEEAIQVGFVDRATKAEDFGITGAKDYLRWQATTKMYKKTGIGLLFNIDELDYVFGEELLNEIAFLNLLAKGTSEFNTYLNVQDKIISKKGSNIVWDQSATPQEKAYYRDYETRIRMSIGSGAYAVLEDVNMFDQIDVSAYGAAVNNISVNDLLKIENRPLLDQIFMLEPDKLNTHIRQYSNENDFNSLVNDLINDLGSINGVDGDILDGSIFKLRDQYNEYENSLRELILKSGPGYESLKGVIGESMSTDDALQSYSDLQYLNGQAQCGDTATYSPILGGCVKLIDDSYSALLPGHSSHFYAYVDLDKLNANQQRNPGDMQEALKNQARGGYWPGRMY